MKHRRNELKQQYKQMKPEMGILMIKSKANGKVYLEATQDLKTATNSGLFKLKFGSHPNKELQQDWKQYGEDNFVIEILDTLEYAKDETVTDYTDDLAELRNIWIDRLSQDNATFYGE